MFKSKTSYSIDTKSDFIYNLAKKYIFHLNEKDGIFVGKSMFGNYIVEADKPIKRGYIVSRNEVEGVKRIDLNKKTNIMKAIAAILGNEDDEFLELCKVKLKFVQPDLLYYYMNVIHSVAYVDGKIDENKVKYIVDEYKFKGVSNIRDRLAVLIKCIQDPIPANIYKLFGTYTDEMGGYSFMCNEATSLAYIDEMPLYKKQITLDLMQQESKQFEKSLIHFLSSIISSSTKENFALKLLTRGQ